METKKENGRQERVIPDCWLRGCFSVGSWRPSLKFPGGSMETSIALCTYHKHNIPDLLGMILSCPGVVDQFKRLLEPYSIEFPSKDKITVEWKRTWDFINVVRE